MGTRSLFSTRRSVELVFSRFIYKNRTLPRVPNDSNVHHDTVSFTSHGMDFKLATKWQDTMPQGSSVGAIVCLHGSPGSHNDFKYINHFLRQKGIRTIGLNFPGIGLTDAHPELQYHNDERDAFIKAMIEKLQIKEKLLWVGHSRGNENALRCAVQLADKSIGAVLINPTGFRVHKGIRPQWVIKLAAWGDKTNSFTRAIMNPITYRVYDRLGLKTDNSDITGKCARTMTTFDFDKLKPFIKDFSKFSHLKVLMFMSGRDFLVEEDITREFLHHFEDSKEMHVPRSEADEDEAHKFIVTRLSKGHRATGVYFPEDGHFMQKHRARLIAKACEAKFNEYLHK